MLIPYEGKKFKVSQTFSLGVHNGMDIVGLDNKTLIALCDGKILQSRIVTDKSNKTWEWGNYVTLQADDGTQIVYAHLSKRLVLAGQRVSKGEPVGIEGNTGYSFGSHCHLEVRNSNNKVTATCNTPIFTGIPNKKETLNINNNIEKEVEDLTERETSIMITDAIRTNNKELIELIDKNKQRVYNTWDEIKSEVSWAYDELSEMYEKGYFKGNENAELGVTLSEIKMLCVMQRILKDMT